MHSVTPPNKELLADLLLRWEDLYERGQDTPAEELARDHPDLIAELARRIRALKTVAWIQKPLDDDPPDDEPAQGTTDPKTLANRYRLDELIAEGGFARVYRAYDQELQRTVAVKVPKPERLHSGEAFLAEARRVARLKHDGIVAVYDCGLENGSCFIVSEYLDGGSLADRIVNQKPSQEEAVRWVAEVAEALEFAHLNGVVHRDLKPANILIDQHGRAKLADFGIAQSATKTGDFAPSLGTLRYMAPEGLQGNAGDHRSDIFSLGIVLHEALTGRIPYSSYEPTVLRREIIAGRQTCSADIPEPLLSVCRKALSHSPHQRHASAAQFAAELRQATRVTPGRVVPWGLLLPIIGAVVLAVAIASAFQNKKPPTATLSTAELVAEAKNLFFQGQHEAAEAKLTEVLEQNPTNADALNKRGICRLKRAAYEKSIEDFTAALDLTPDDPVLWKHRAMAYGSLREFEPAIRDFTKTLELDPNAKDARESFGATYSVMAAEKADGKHFQEAAELMDKAITIYPEAAVFYHQRGSCFFHLGEYQKAIDDLNVAIGKEPIKPDHYENRALSLQRMGRHEEADADFEKARELRSR